METLNRANQKPKSPDSHQEALQSALRFLSYRARSEAEILTHLSRKGYSAAIGAEILEKLRSLNYVNDESFARNWALSRAEGRGYGLRRIEQELKAKGIVHSLVREIITATFSRDDEKKKAKELLEKKFKGVDLSDPKILRRAGAFLQRRGYSSDVIFDVVRLRAEDD